MSITGLYAVNTDHIIAYSDDGQESASVFEGVLCDHGHCVEVASDVVTISHGEGTVDIRPMCNKHAVETSSRTNYVVQLVPFRFGVSA